MELLAYDEKTDSYYPTGNAILLFGKQPRSKFPQAAVKAKVDYSNGKQGAETFNDPLVLIPDKVDKWIEKVLPASIDRSKFKVTQAPAFPPEIIREALINAIIHRDYSLDGAKVQLEINTDRIIVQSPRAPPSPVTIILKKLYCHIMEPEQKTIIYIQRDGLYGRIWNRDGYL